MKEIEFLSKLTKESATEALTQRIKFLSSVSGFHDTSREIPDPVTLFQKGDATIFTTFDSEGNADCIFSEKSSEDSQLLMETHFMVIPRIGAKAHEPDLIDLREVSSPYLSYPSTLSETESALWNTPIRDLVSEEELTAFREQNRLQKTVDETLRRALGLSRDEHYLLNPLQIMEYIALLDCIDPQKDMIPPPLEAS